jgi:hypothetical protein
MERDFGRGTRRVLRQLANTAWERELNAELTTLAASFAEWKSGALGPHALSVPPHLLEALARGIDYYRSEPLEPLDEDNPHQPE